MEVAQDKINLIIKVIKANRKYINNEDLYDDFFNETYERSLSIINDIETLSTLEAYLKKIATTSMVSVLKNNGRLRRTSSGFIASKEVELDEVVNVDFSSINVSYSSMKLQKDPEEIVIQKEILDFVAQAIVDIDKKNPEKKYLRIFKMRYEDGMTQKDIAMKMSISQSEVSKRLYSLMERVRDLIE